MATAPLSGLHPWDFHGFWTSKSLGHRVWGLGTSKGLGFGGMKGLGTSKGLGFGGMKGLGTSQGLGLRA